jgi:signal transduction histidine kinase
MIAVATRSATIVPTGLPFGQVRWGAHLCHFFLTAEDVEEIAAPFFAAGLANHEKCIWIVNTPLTAERARARLANQVSQLDDRIRDGQLAIVDRADWLTRTGRIESERRIEHWLERERIALADGFAGLRFAGDTLWEDDDWHDLAAHEARMHRAIHERRITALCSYPLERCGPHEIMDVLRNHKSTLMRRDGTWEHIGSATAALALVGAAAVVDEPGDKHEHLVVLQRITSALGEAVTFDNIGAIVTAEIAPAIDATRVGLVIDGQLIALRGITTPEDPAALAHVLEQIPAQWSQRGALSPEIAWVGAELVAVLPLVFAHDRIGTLVLGFERPAISIAQRALVDDLVRQLSLTVERARIYEQATAGRIRAERAITGRDQFLAMLGHELRNPLSPMLGAVQLMQLREPEKLVQERSTIERSIANMVRLVDDLLDVSRIACDDVTLAREPLDLAELVSRAVETARRTMDRRVGIAVAIPQGLVVDVDPKRMQQALVNLVINAATSTTEGDDGIEIDARVHGDAVEIVVRDHGCGFDPAMLPYMFELFAPGKQLRSKASLGVGLPIAHSIVELHGGTLTAASEGEGCGSTFTIRLPRFQVMRSEQVKPPSGGRRVLVVDDNEDAAWLLAEALRLLGHDVRVAYEGIAALEVAREWSPEVALLDIGLPGMNGFELCRELGKLAVRPHCIAVSGYGQPKDRALAREAGFDAHFVKPVDLRDVQAAIDALSASN